MVWPDSSQKDLDGNVRVPSPEWSGPDTDNSRADRCYDSDLAGPFYGGLVVLSYNWTLPHWWEGALLEAPASTSKGQSIS